MKKSLLFLFLLGLCYSGMQAQDGRIEILKHILKEKIRYNSHMEGGFSMTGLSKSVNDTAIDIKITNNSVAGEEEGEPFIIVNPTDSNNIVLSYMHFGGTSSLVFPVYYSANGGQSWNLSSFDTEQIFDLDSTGLVIAGGGDPIFAFDSNGRLYFSWIYLGVNVLNADSKFIVYWAWSDDNGATFQLSEGEKRHILLGEINLLTYEMGLNGDGIFDRPWFDIDRSGGPFDGSLYCSGLFIPNDSTPLDGNGMICKYKRANVDSFAYVNTVVSNAINVQFGNLRVDGSGNVHVTYVNLDNNKLYHRMSSDGGVSFGTINEVAVLSYDYNNQNYLVHTRENPVPSLTINRLTNSLHIVWTSFENDMTRSYYSNSTDFGANWTTPQSVSDIIVQADKQVFMPTLAVNESGHLSISGHVLDSLDRGTYFVVESLDEGATFGEAIIVASDTTFYGDYPLQQQAFFGDYENSDKSGCKTYSIWSDGRYGEGPKIYVSITDHCADWLGLEDVFPVSDQIQLQSVYPNPVKDYLDVQLNLKNNTSLSIKLVNTNGQLIKEIYQSDDALGMMNLHLNIGHLLETGYFLMIIETELGVITKSLIKI
jgi:hypothetical protein